MLSELRGVCSLTVVPVSGHVVPFHGADPDASGPGQALGQDHDNLAGVGVDHLVSFLLELPDLYCDRHVSSLEGASFRFVYTCLLHAGMQSSGI